MVLAKACSAAITCLTAAAVSALAVSGFSAALWLRVFALVLELRACGLAAQPLIRHAAATTYGFHLQHITGRPSKKVTDAMVHRRAPFVDRGARRRTGGVTSRPSRGSDVATS